MHVVLFFKCTTFYLIDCLILPWTLRDWYLFLNLNLGWVLEEEWSWMEAAMDFEFVTLCWGNWLRWVLRLDLLIWCCVNLILQFFQVKSRWWRYARNQRSPRMPIRMPRDRRQLSQRARTRPQWPSRLVNIRIAYCHYELTSVDGYGDTEYCNVCWRENRGGLITEWSV